MSLSDRILIARSATPSAAKPPSGKSGRGKASADRELLLPLANRHGLIAGATGTGKSVTLRVLAEGLSAAGVPVFLADVKGDLAGMAAAGGQDARVAARAKDLGLELVPEAMPTLFWDVLGEQGHPVRATVSDMGPLLLARLLELNETQASVLQLAFKIADDRGLLLLDLKDLRALLQHIGDNAAAYTTEYGNIAPASIGAIQRAVVALGAQGGDTFFGEPMLDLADLMRRDGRGRGIVSILAADKLMMRPRLYATFLLWLLAELFETLPEVGDLDAPKLVFVFDEAHLLFTDAPAALVGKVEQVIRLIRSKGVGVYFVTQNPLDIPETVLGQLGNKIQHALRAFTPRDQKAVRAAAETFRANPALDTSAAILELGVGEALVSLLNADGAPAPVERALIVPPRSRLGPIDPAARQNAIHQSPVAGKYETTIDRESAYEKLAGESSASGGIMDALGSIFSSKDKETPPRPASRRPASGGLGDAMAKSVVRNIAGQIGREIGRQIMRGVLGSMRRR